MGRSAGRGGLEGVVATTSSISEIVGDTLTYRGYDVVELARESTYEEVACLLWNGELPSADELHRFRTRLVEERVLPPLVVGMLRDLPADGDLMVALRIGVSALSLTGKIEDQPSAEARRESLELLASFPTMVATLHRLKSGQDPIEMVPAPGIATGFLASLTGTMPSPDAARALDVAMILHADHELNASTFAARVAASTRVDLHSAVIAGLCALKGPLHGGAAQHASRVMAEVGSVSEVRQWVESTLQRGERIPGFGHRVYRHGDPRARVLKELAKGLAESSGDLGRYETAVRLEEEVLARTGLLPNVDFYSSVVYEYLGIPRELFTAVFAMCRMAGWIAHILEQYSNNRLIRPRAEYTGRAPREYTPIGKR